jgi:hypothetical protein
MLRQRNNEMVLAIENPVKWFPTGDKEVKHSGWYYLRPNDVDPVLWIGPFKTEADATLVYTALYGSDVLPIKPLEQSEQS